MASTPLETLSLSPASIAIHNKSYVFWYFQFLIEIFHSLPNRELSSGGRAERQ